MSKKMMILIVIVECVLAVLLIGVIGLAIESTYTDVTCREIAFTLPDGTILTADDVITVDRPDRGYQMYYVFTPEDTTDKTVTFSTNKPDKVLINESGYVTFIEDTDVTVTVLTKNGKTATITLVPKRDTHGTVELD